MRVVIRVDAAPEMGTGHLMRCRTLAEGLKAEGADVVFVCRRISDAARASLTDRGHDVRVLENGGGKASVPGDLQHSHWLPVSQIEDAEQTLRAISGGVPDWFVVDHYALDVRWERRVRQTGARVMVIDDLADRQHECEVLLDQNLVANLQSRYTDRVPESCNQLLGPRYALLSPSYSEMREHVVPRTTVKRILVFFGGSDLNNLTGRALEGVLSLERPDIQVDVVLSLNSETSGELEALAGRHENVTCHRGLATLAPLVATADLAIGSFGATSWERLCLGLPTLAVLMARNQEEVAAALHEAGLAICIGSTDTVDAPAIATHVARVLTDGDLRAWSARCMEYCDGRGTQRVLQALASVPARREAS